MFSISTTYVKTSVTPAARRSPLLKSPFLISPRVRSTWVGFIGFMLSVQRSEDRCGEVILTFAVCIKKICKAPDNTNS